MAKRGISMHVSTVSSQDRPNITASMRQLFTELRTSALAFSATVRPILSTSECRREERRPEQGGGRETCWAESQRLLQRLRKQMWVFKRVYWQQVRGQNSLSQTLVQFDEQCVFSLCFIIIINTMYICYPPTEWYLLLRFLFQIAATECRCASRVAWWQNNCWMLFPPGLFSSKKCTSCCMRVWNSRCFSLLFSLANVHMNIPPLKPENRELLG